MSAAPIHTQEQAVKAALHGTPLDRAKIAVGALRRLMQDPETTENVFLLGLTVNHGRVHNLLEQFVRTESGDWLLSNKPWLDSSQVDYDALRALPQGSLGREYVRFLDDNDLDADFFDEPPGLPPILAFIARRMRQAHDVWHTVTGYGSDPSGEVELQAFTFGQTGVPSSGLIALAGTVRGSVDDADLVLRVFRAFRRGKQAEKFAPVIWERMWELPIEQVREQLKVS